MIGQRARNRLRLLAAVSAAAAQLLIAGAPLAEARLGPDVRAHVEVAGTSLHHAHDEATCAACVSQHLLAGSEAAQSANWVLFAASSRASADVVRADSRSPRFFIKSRAPPARTV